jgi:hypothetical protein
MIMSGEDTENFHITEMKNCWKMKVLLMATVGVIEGETESTIAATQDQAISTKYFKKKILKEETESKCELYKEYEETIYQFPSGCPLWQNINTSQGTMKYVHIYIIQHATN